MVCKKCNSEMNVEKMKTAFYNGKWQNEELCYVCRNCNLEIKIMNGKIKGTYVVKEIVAK